MQKKMEKEGAVLYLKLGVLLTDSGGTPECTISLILHKRQCDLTV